MGTLIIILLIVGALLTWSALTTCSLGTFQPQTRIRSRLNGPSAHADLVTGLRALPGVREIDRGQDEVLFSVVPVPSSMDRGWGLFILARRDQHGAELLGRRKLPLPGPSIEGALQQLEREASRR
jgi:hypothetical protein